MSRPRPFVHLDVRSYFSLKDGAFSPEELATRAAELGMPAVAMTDRDGLYGAARFVNACTKVGVRPILGATLTLDPEALARCGAVAPTLQRARRSSTSRLRAISPELRAASGDRS
ncbi:MAG: PHP domain-containing protein, partial [Actinomycetota bacterium]|nr:PHP domain-containing protein [Actinomycetota bacterium]